MFDTGEHAVAKLNVATGIDDLIKIMNGIFTKDPLSNGYNVWKKVLGFRREKGMKHSSGREE